MPSTDTQASAAAMAEAAAIGAEGGVPAASAEALRQGINLQGWKLWDPGAFVTPAMAARFAADGFDHARIYYHAGMTRTGPVDNDDQRWPRDEAALDADAVTDRIEDSMHNLIAAGLKVVINPVPDFSPDDTAATRQAKLDFFALWAEHIVGEFGSDSIVIETANEPTFGSAAAWQAVERQVVGIVRAASPDVTIVSASEMFHNGRWDQFGGFAAHRAYDDPNIVYSAHIYEPWGFVTQAYGPYTWPANPADNPNPGDGNFNWYYGGQHTRLALEKLVLAYGTEADAGGLEHWMIGEFGAMERADSASRQAYFATMTLAAERAGGGWSLWKGYGDDHEMAIYDDATTPGGERTLVLDDPATPVSLGLAPRPAVPLTVSVSGPAEQDLLHPFGGRSYAPAEGQTLALSGAGMGGAGGSARVVRDGQGAVTVTGTGAPAGVGILDDAPLRATVTGVQRAQIEGGAEGASTLDITAREATAITGDGADVVDVTLRAMAGVRTLQGWIWTGEGDDEIAVLQKTVPPAGSWLEIASGAGHDRLDLTAFKGGVRVNAGSGDDRIALHGKGGTAAAAARVDGAVGTDTVVLEGLAADWRLLTRSDPEGPAQLAKSTAYGSYLLVNVEHVAFAGAAGQAAQGGGFDLVA